MEKWQTPSCLDRIFLAKTLSGLVTGSCGSLVLAAVRKTEPRGWAEGHLGPLARVPESMAWGPH